MNTILKAALALAVLWGAIYGIMWVAGTAKVTPETVAAYLEENSLETIEDPDERLSVVRKLADQLNQLDVEQRRNARQNGNGPMRGFFESMTPGERAEFIELTIGPTFNHMMKAFNEMEPDERRKVADRALTNLRDNDGMREGGQERWDEEGGAEMIEKVTSEGLRAYYQEASADTKVDFAPVLEELQRAMQRRRFHRDERPKDRGDLYKNK